MVGERAGKSGRLQVPVEWNRADWMMSPRGVPHRPVQVNLLATNFWVEISPHRSKS